jgi:hypothetical protein
VGVKSTSRADRLRAGLGGAAARSRAVAGAWAAWVLLLAGWVLAAAGVWLQFGRGWAALLAGGLLMLFAATLVDVDQGGR